MGTHVLWTPGRDARRDANADALANLGFTVHEDVNYDGLMATWCKALDVIEWSDTDWALIVTDDAIPFPGWHGELELALRHSPSPVLSVTHFARAGQDAAAAGYAYGLHGIWGPAVALRTDIVTRVIELAGQVLEFDPLYPHDDGLLYLWAKSEGVPLAYTSRALFDHAPWPSLMGHGGVMAQRRPLLTIESDGPAWDASGAWSGFNPYVGNVTKRIMEGLAL